MANLPNSSSNPKHDEKVTNVSLSETTVIPRKRTLFTETEEVHNNTTVISYSSVCGLYAPPHLIPSSSSNKQPNLIINDHLPAPPAPAGIYNSAKGKKKIATPSIEDFLETIDLKIRRTVNNNNNRPAIITNKNKGNADQNAPKPDDDDGQIHSLPCGKNGPYKCSKCERVYLTSQQFAAHVSSIHYRSETKEQRRKRQKAKLRSKRNNNNNMRRNVIQHAAVNDDDGDGDLTTAPIFYEWEGTTVAPVNSGGNNSTNDGQGGGGAFSASKVVKEEELGSGNDDDSVVPPGFQAVTIKREPFA